ncbi:hypothetical protein T484DRAFT_1840355 [Baffinella frigidus]|nr:hypothetical protein T484DRAFT_1840355 [Cryptophyta sp. CCMP2293]
MAARVLTTLRDALRQNVGELEECTDLLADERRLLVQNVGELEECTDLLADERRLLVQIHL